MPMGDKYTFSRVAILCTTKGDALDGKPLTRDMYYQCMCDEGISTYCSRVSGATTPEPSVNDATTENPWPFYNHFENVDSFFSDKKDEVKPVFDPEINWTTESSSTNQMGSIVTWIGIFFVITCVFYIASRCSGKCGGSSSQGAVQVPHAQARSAGEAETGTAANNSDGGGGCGGGGQEATPTAPSTDLPPPYDLVFEQHPKPPPYEDVIREDAKMDPGEVV